MTLPSSPTGIETYPFDVRPEDVYPCPECKAMPSLIPVMFLSYNMKCSTKECSIGYPDQAFIRDSRKAIERWNEWAAANTRCGHCKLKVHPTAPRGKCIFCEEEVCTSSGSMTETLEAHDECLLDSEPFDGELE